ncbi:MAG: hypothetical protein ACREUV_00930 [Burkholderiales bacterium]
MGISHADFFRTLPAALGGAAFSVNGLDVTVPENDRCLVISLSVQTERRLGLVVLPVTIVEFCFSGYSLEETRFFFRRFDPYYQRGLG